MGHTPPLIRIVMHITWSYLSIEIDSKPLLFVCDLMPTISETQPINSPWKHFKHTVLEPSDCAQADLFTFGHHGLAQKTNGLKGL